MINIHSLFTWMSNIYLLENDTSTFLVDAGAPGYEKQILQLIHQTGKDLKLIYITHAHFDHYGCAARLREKTGAKIAIHHADAEAISKGQTPIRSAHGRGRLTMPFLPLFNLTHARFRTSPDILLYDNDSLDPYGLHAHVIHTPGHTVGSTCLLVENGDNDLLAFTGDLVAGSNHPHLQNLYADDWSQLPESLKKVQSAWPTQVFPGHGSHSIPGDVFQQIK